jgi:hypothetical protein
MGVGSSQAPKYVNSEDARVALGYDTWLRVKSQLEKYRGRSIDFDGFDKLLRSRFERMVCELMCMPFVLCDCDCDCMRVYT